MRIAIFSIRVIREMGVKQRKEVYKRLYAKLPLNRAVLAGQFTSTSEGDFNHPTLGHKTEYQCGGSGVPVTRTCPPVSPCKYHPDSY